MGNPDLRERVKGRILELFEGSEEGTVGDPPAPRAAAGGAAAGGGAGADNVAAAGDNPSITISMTLQPGRHIEEKTRVIATLHFRRSIPENALKISGSPPAQHRVQNGQIP